MSPILYLLLAVVLVVVIVLVARPTLIPGLLVDATLRQLRKKAGLSLATT